ncbi:SpoIID/LytB domain-containing protein, partial [bacterium]
MTKTKLRIFMVALALLFGCSGISARRAAGGNIRVLVLKGAQALTIKNADNTKSFEVKKTSPGRASVNGTDTALPHRFFPNKGYIYMNNRPYAGSIEVFDNGAGLLAINEVQLETYLAGILNNEISTKWPADALKTQVVVARTYALYQKKKRLKENYHIEGSVMGQVYTGVGGEDAAALKAVRDTIGEVLNYNGEPALTVYHSNAGGMTEDSKDVWGVSAPYLRPVESKYDGIAPKYLWEHVTPAMFLKDALNLAGYDIGDIEDITVDLTSASGRVKRITVRDRNGKKLSMTGEDLRKAAGYSNVRSTLFIVSRDGNSFVFKGRGSGHGVGLSQWGAKVMAEKGDSYKEILRHYYPGTVLGKA